MLGPDIKSAHMYFCRYGLNMQSELRLFLDKGAPLSGKPHQQNLRCWILNNSASSIEILKLELKAVSPGIDFNPYNPPARPIAPDTPTPLLPSFRVADGAEYSFRIHLTARIGASKKSFMTDDIQLNLREGKLEINIGYQGLVDGVECAGDMHIKTGGSARNQHGVGGESMFSGGIKSHGGDVIIDAASAAAVKNLKISHQWHRPAEFKEENLHEEKLHPCDSLKGIHPVDFKLLDETWQGKSFMLDFVDEDGHSWNKKPAVGDIYRIRIRSRGDGYLTLIGQGSSKTFFILAPNNTSPAESFLLKAGQTYYYPSQHFLSFEGMVDHRGEPIVRFDFGDPGLEIVLATLTSGPVYGQNSIFFQNELCDLDEAAVTALLETINKQEEAALAVASIEVQKKSFRF